MDYLLHYGESANRRHLRFRRMLVALLTPLIAGGILFYAFHNYRQERQARRFLGQLAAGNYPASYAYWVRGDSDRRGYPMEAFLDDWGPGGRHGVAKIFRVVKSRSCGSGVIVTIRSASGQEERLWVERGSLLLGFPPPVDLLPKICSL
jgi:hypothetical protein